MKGVYDIVIVGGGVIGLTAAWQVAKHGLSVAVVDRRDLGRESSWAGAGILPPAESSGPHDAEAAFYSLSYRRFAELSAELKDATGIDNEFRVCGGLLVSQTECSSEWHCHGAAFQMISAAEARVLEPTLSPPGGQIVWIPRMAQLRNPRHLQALIAACRSEGVDLFPGERVCGFRTNANRVESIITATGLFRAEKVVLAAGAWSGSLAGQLGISVPIKPIRGQIVLLRTHVAPPRRIILDGSRYIVPRLDGRVLVGSTEEDVGFLKLTTATAIGQLIDLATRLVPSLGNATVEKCWAGLRPGSPDGKPLLGTLPGWENVFLASGHFRAGIQLSPATAAVVCDWVLGRTPANRLDAFNPVRFNTQ